MTERKVKLVHDDREVLTLIENLIQNTTPSHSKSSDPFWENPKPPCCKPSCCTCCTRLRPKNKTSRW